MEKMKRVEEKIEERKPKKKRPRGAASKYSPGKLKGAQRALRAMELRREGKTYREIAEELGYAGKTGAAAAVRRVLQEVNKRTLEEGEAYRALHLIRLEGLLSAVWPKAVNGDVDCWDRALTVAEKAAKLMGVKLEPEEQQPQAGSGVNVYVGNVLSQLPKDLESMSTGEKIAFMEEKMLAVRQQKRLALKGGNNAFQASPAEIVEDSTGEEEDI